MNLALILALAVAIVAVVFAFQNPQEVQVQFLSLRSIPASLSLVLLVTFTFGLLTGWLGSLPGRLRARREARAALRRDRQPDILRARLRALVAADGVVVRVNPAVFDADLNAPLAGR